MKLPHTLHPALEDGTDRGFRNFGKPQSDAGEIPKRIHTQQNKLLVTQLNKYVSRFFVTNRVVILCAQLSNSLI
jgi:hypothetical protein